MPPTRTDATCSHCDRAAIAGGLCMRHYQQSRRGRLGKTRPQTPRGEAAEITVAVPRAEKAKMIKAARAAKISLSAWCRARLTEALTPALNR